MDDILHSLEGLSNIFQRHRQNFEALKSLEGLNVIKKEAFAFLERAASLETFVSSANFIGSRITPDDDWKQNLLSNEQFFHMTGNILGSIKDLRRFEDLKSALDDFLRKIYTENNLKAAKDVKIALDDIIWKAKQNFQTVLGISHRLLKFANDDYLLDIIDKDSFDDREKFLPYMKNLGEWWNISQINPLKFLLEFAKQHLDAPQNQTDFFMAFTKLQKSFVDNLMAKNKDVVIPEKLKSLNSQIITQGSCATDLLTELCHALYYSWTMIVGYMKAFNGKPSLQQYYDHSNTLVDIGNTIGDLLYFGKRSRSN